MGFAYRLLLLRSGLIYCRHQILKQNINKFISSQYSSSNTISREISNASEDSDDYFGVQEFLHNRNPAEDAVGDVLGSEVRDEAGKGRRVVPDNVVPLDMLSMQHTREQDFLDSTAVVHVTSYGNVRYDSENVETKTKAETSQVMENMFSQFNKPATYRDMMDRERIESEAATAGTDGDGESDGGFSFIDEDYFGRRPMREETLDPDPLQAGDSPDSGLSEMPSRGNYIEEQYFNVPAEVNNTTSTSAVKFLHEPSRSYKVRVRKSDDGQTQLLRRRGRRRTATGVDNAAAQGNVQAGSGRVIRGIVFSPSLIASLRGKKGGAAEGSDEVAGVEQDTDSSPSSSDTLTAVDDTNMMREDGERVERTEQTENKTPHVAKSQSGIGQTQRVRETDEEIVVQNFLTHRELRRRSQTKPNLDNPQTAYDMAMKMRLEMKMKSRVVGRDKDEDRRSTESSIQSAHLDSRGFWDPRHLMPRLEDVSGEVVLRMLRDSVVYEDGRLLVLDKPYGLNTDSHSPLTPQDGAPATHSRHSVERYLGALSDVFCDYHLPGNADNRLILVHRLDRTTSGIIMLAKNVAVANKLQQMFADREIGKTYVAITKGVPSPDEGIIDIPIGESKIGNKSRMALFPVLHKEHEGIIKRHSSATNTKAAVTAYKVIARYEDYCALVEVKPKTGVKHQIRCHLGFALNCPIIGDHKYSSLTKLVTQKLPAAVLQRLNLRQAKVRNLPIHLHSKAIVIPGYFEDSGKSLHVQCSLPKYFRQQMERLKLTARFQRKR